MIKGRIHSFENFGTVDGPGIRFVVFMQGCPLRCVYCHNPDTWDLKGGSLFTPTEVLEKAKKFIPYFKSSSGGVTVSGGEPLLQVEFVTELFRLCKENGISTALDTSGFSPCLKEGNKSKINQLFEFTDLVLLDIKHMDINKHKEITGSESQYGFEFANLSISANVDLWIRYVIVPGLTDDAGTLKKFGKYIKDLGRVQKVEFLPFHKLGAYKWNSLNLEFSLKDCPEASESDIERAYSLSGI